MLRRFDTNRLALELAEPDQEMSDLVARRDNATRNRASSVPGIVITISVDDTTIAGIPERRCHQRTGLSVAVLSALAKQPQPPTTIQ